MRISLYIITGVFLLAAKLHAQPQDSSAVWGHFTGSDSWHGYNLDLEPGGNFVLKIHNVHCGMVPGTRVFGEYYINGDTVILQSGKLRLEFYKLIITPLVALYKRVSLPLFGSSALKLIRPLPSDTSGLVKYTYRKEPIFLFQQPSCYRNGLPAWRLSRVGKYCTKIYYYRSGHASLIVTNRIGSTCYRCYHYSDTGQLMRVEKHRINRKKRGVRL